MKIALVGYGNMGPEVEKIATSLGHEIVSVSFRKISDKLDLEGIKTADVVIDFTSPAIVVENIKQVLKLKKKIVVGTTGWYDSLPKIKKMVVSSGGGLIYAKNFSVGANIFFKVLGVASKLFDKYGGYDVYGYEIHHSGKKDSPSGTAKKIGDIIISNFSTKKTLMADKLDRQVKSSELHFASIRGGRNPGTHEVIFDSDADEVRMSHIAHGRAGFAKGAILAAEFIKGKKGFYSFEELFERGAI